MRSIGRKRGEGMKTKNEIFVFGSNLAGRHGAGSALHARRYYGAVYGVGDGRTGNAYAIPTKDSQLRTLPLAAIADYVGQFIKYAELHPELTFVVVSIGCGLAGFHESKIIPMFKDAPPNCYLPDGWREKAR